MSATEDLFGDVEADEHADWSTGTIAPENIDFSKYDLLFFAFATPNQSNGLNWDDGSQSTLKRLVSAAHGAGTKVSSSFEAHILSLNCYRSSCQ